ncbi:2TM domain-containing protein [Flavobacterium sp. N1994]|uniref:2TM domain-containing protein n=1 Tax=Flavobacterium sp. N1994 TaxID=2986827 RepID=UPI0022233B21|nr:2TM domain-containing protein [Flavobacterium sp. N1994]
MEAQQHELYEYARDRIKQKKGLFYHFILLFLGGVFLIIANNWLGFYPETTWWTWAVTLWIFFFILHVIKVFVINNFMNKHWEREQIDKLMLRQASKIEKLKNDLENSKPSAE